MEWTPHCYIGGIDGGTILLWLVGLEIADRIVEGVKKLKPLSKRRRRPARTSRPREGGARGVCRRRTRHQNGV